MYLLFAVPVVSLVLILVAFVSSLFDFKRAKPMLEQIEEARFEAHRHEMNADYELKKVYTLGIER